MVDSNRKVIVVGGGPVGALTAVFLSRRGIHVDLYDARCDIRKDLIECGRSINLSLSHRGITALKKAGFDKTFSSLSTPMHSQCIHINEKKKVTIPFGQNGECLLSISRSELTKALLLEAEKSPGINLHFQHKLIQCDLSSPSATFQKPNGERITINDADAIFGCDGAHSTVRRIMMKTRMDFKQTYVDHGYKELIIPTTSGGDYPLSPDYFHIWPRQEFLLIAVPNLDKSFTCNLFLPFEKYEEIITGEDVVCFFDKYFHDVLPLIGEDFLRESFFVQSACPMITVHCKPYHRGSTSVLLGDAAHAMLPFSGQGLNCGLEDALIIDELMEEFGCNFTKVLQTFSEVRIEAGHKIADFSLDNYADMRSLVRTRWVTFRQKVDSVLENTLPKLFQNRKYLVTFTRKPYHTALQTVDKRDKVVDVGIISIGCLALSLCACGLLYIAKYLNLSNSWIR